MSSNMFSLSTLNRLSFTEHTFWPSKPQLPNSPDETHELKNEIMCHELTMGFDEIISPWVLDHGLWHRFLVIMGSFGL